jgi:hypothetical protein
MPFPEDWRQFIESLNSNGAEYLVVGAVVSFQFQFSTWRATCLRRLTPA